MKCTRQRCQAAPVSTAAIACLRPSRAEERPDGRPFSTECDSAYTLKTGAGEGQQGNYQLLRFPDCNEDTFTGGGGAAVREFTANGYQCCQEIGTVMSVETKTGNTVGPFRQGLDIRWDQDTDKTENICYEQYQGNGKRVVITPIIDSFDVNGTKFVRIEAFAAFFLTRRPLGGGMQMELTGQFIRMVAPGEFGTSEVNSGIYGIHLVE